VTPLIRGSAAETLAEEDVAARGDAVIVATFGPLSVSVVVVIVTAPLASEVTVVALSEVSAATVSRGAIWKASSASNSAPVVMPAARARARRGDVFLFPSSIILILSLS